MPAERLKPEEHAALGDLGAVVDCRRVRLYRRSEGGAGLLRSAVLWASRNRAVALGNHVFLPDHCHDDLPTLAHELTHCGQFQAWGFRRYFMRGMIAQVRALLHQRLGIGTNPYRYQVELGKPFREYGMEQQGQIVEDCFRGHPAAQNISPFQPGRESEGP